MGTALRNLTKDIKKTGVTLGGRGHRKLTLAAINKLTLYYGKAIRSCTGDKDAMRSAVFASFFHAASTEEEPHHNHCPVGRNSWCFFQRALAKGGEPGYHRDKVGTPLTKDVAEKVKEVYVRLGHPDLLDRCLQVKTQNANESLHSKVWLKWPKTGFVGLMRVVAATCLAIAEFNQGIGSMVTRSYAIMGLQCGSRLSVSCRGRQSSVLRVCAASAGQHDGGSSGTLPVGRSFRQARFGRKTIEYPLVGSKGDTLMVNHGLIASANMSKVNIWGWLLPAK